MQRALSIMAAACALFGCDTVSTEVRKSWPRTCEQAVEKILTEMPDVELKKFAKFKKEELINLHLGLGMGIRNEFGLWHGNRSLIRDCSGKTNTHPDDVSMIIIEKTWSTLKEGSTVN